MDFRSYAGTALPPGLAVTAILLPGLARRRRALVGVLIAALALAGLSASGGGSRSFNAVTAALLLLGAGVPVAIAVRSRHDAAWPAPARRVGLGVAALVTCLGLWLAMPLAVEGGLLMTGSTVGVLLGLAALGRVIAGAVRSIRPAPSREASTASPPDRAILPSDMDRGAGRLLAVNFLGAVVALVAPQLVVLLAAVLVSAVAGHRLERRLGERSLMGSIGLLVALLALGLSGYLLIHVAWGVPLSLTQLGEAPYSEAFQITVALLLGICSWVYLGTWPFRARWHSPFTGLLGAALWLRVVHPLLPLGAIHWQPAFYPVVTLAAWHAALTRRNDEPLVALGALGLLSGDSAGGWCGAGLVAGAGLLALGAGQLPLARWCVPIAALLLVPVLSAALQAQVVYTVLTTLGLMVALVLIPPVDRRVDPLP